MQNVATVRDTDTLPNVVSPPPRREALTFISDDARVESFGRALDELKREVEADLGKADAEYILRVGAWSRRLEYTGRILVHFSIEPVGFGLGVAALTAHKALELMEIGHPAIHGCYDNLPGAERYASKGFVWKAPIDEASWHRLHNVLHHQYTNIAGKDPDIDFAVFRLSGHVPHRFEHLLQPFTNVLSFFAFGMALNMHATGMIDLYARKGPTQVLPDRSPATKRAATRAFVSKLVRHYGKEYVGYPLLAGPFFPKVLFGNLVSEVARDVYAATIIYCGHVGARDYPRGTEPKSRAHWYVLQAEGSRDVEVPTWVSILCGALDKQIEHHLFPRLPPRRLREIAPRVRAICEAHGVTHRSESWPATLRSVWRELARLASPRADTETFQTAAAAE